MATTMTSKGQVTIPKRVRELLGIRPGMAVDFALTAGGEVVVRAAGRARKAGGGPPSPFARARGSATVRMRTDEILALTRGDGHSGR